MAGDAQSKFLDLLASTLDEFPRAGFHSIAARLPDYECMGRALRKERRMMRGGNGYNETIVTDHSHKAKHQGLYASKTYKGVDTTAKMTVPWRHTTTDFAWDRREAKQNMSGPKQVFNLLKKKEYEALLSLAEKLEATFCGTPTSASDEITPWGLFYWMTYNAQLGHYGGNQANFPTGRGNINSDVYTRWKNGTGQYAKIAKNDAIKKMRKLAKNVKFKSPVDVEGLRKGAGDRCRYYCGEDTETSFEDVGESQNENLGRDIASMDGQMVFKKNPIVRLAQLDEMTTSAPIIALNWEWIKFMVMEGEYIERSKPRTLDLQPTVAVVDYDLSWNLVFEDLRSHFLIAKSDPLSDPSLPSGANE